MNSLSFNVELEDPAIESCLAGIDVLLSSNDESGFYVPELTEYASCSIKRAMDINNSNNNYCSTSLTCEMGLSRTTGEDFQSLLSIADESLK